MAAERKIPPSRLISCVGRDPRLTLHRPPGVLSRLHHLVADLHLFGAAYHGEGQMSLRRSTDIGDERCQCAIDTWVPSAIHPACVSFSHVTRTPRWHTVYNLPSVTTRDISLLAHILI